MYTRVLTTELTYERLIFHKYETMIKSKILQEFKNFERKRNKIIFIFKKYTFDICFPFELILRYYDFLQVYLTKLNYVGPFLLCMYSYVVQ